MRIGGFRRISLVEYPGKISSVVFTVGCNFRCPYCYVPQLVLPERFHEVKEVSEDEVFAYLERNRGLVDAVVITGGEPTLQGDLARFAGRVKSMGFLVGLETNGSMPRVLERLIDDGLVDYVAMDVKTRLEFESYRRVVGYALSRSEFEGIVRSVRLILSSGVDHEFRTTVVKELHRAEDLIEVCRFIKGAKAYYIQAYKDMNGNLSSRRFTSFTEAEVKPIIEECKCLVRRVGFRG